MSESAVHELPLFPLGAVLFPEGRLGLRVFEPRYLDMVSDCLREDGSFGICLIRDGREVGSAAQPYEIGTEARIIDWDRNDDGLLGLTVHGGRRFRAETTQVQPDNLLLAEVSWLADDIVPLPAEYTPLAELLWQLLQQVEPERASEGERFSDAAWVGYRLAECLPLQAEQSQALLAQDDPVVRLQALAAVVQAMDQRGG
ncbi:MAG: LON peptidase substrate-binding domain-containing protein [Gammaproteobacteria bacterium]|nr:LON peptidase substrate-binding domain-containing protein [Gammaproteobacteria bacterium]